MADRSTSPVNLERAFRESVAERLKNPDETNAEDDSKSEDAARENEEFLARVRGNFSDQEARRQRWERFEERRKGDAAPAEEVSPVRRKATGKEKTAVPTPPADPLSLSEAEIQAGYEAAERVFEGWLSAKMARDLEGVTDEPDEDEPDEWDEEAA